MKKYVVLLFTILFLAACNENESLSENATIAQNYLLSEGFEVVSHDGDDWQEFSEAELLEPPNEQLWAVQAIKPDDYVNKRIDTVSFTVKNHPLDEQFNMGKTSVTVWLLNGEVIGGWSFPVSNTNDLIGAPSSLDGKTAEEVQGDYPNWQAQWREKYSKL